LPGSLEALLGDAAKWSFANDRTLCYKKWADQIKDLEDPSVQLLIDWVQRMRFTISLEEDLKGSTWRQLKGLDSMVARWAVNPRPERNTQVAWIQEIERAVWPR